VGLGEGRVVSRFGLVLVMVAALIAGAGTMAAISWHNSAPPPPDQEPVRAPPRFDPPVLPAPPSAVTGAALVERLLALGEGREVQDVERTIVSMGEGAVPLVIARLSRGGVGGERRERLIELLRQLPGAAAEERLALEARSGPQDSTRTMAIDALASRGNDRALETLAAIARTDPKLPATPLIAQPRDPNVPSTALPDEQTFTPRMQAMAALAETKDPRALAVLIELVRSGADESLRMEAARDLGALRADPRAAAALRTAAATDVSPYVRLAALHALNGSGDPALAPILAQIIAEDRDAGVRALALQVQASLPR
jgi:HEAT repeat protein